MISQIERAIRYLGIVVLFLGLFSGEVYAEAPTETGTTEPEPLAYTFKDTSGVVRLEGSSTVTDWSCESSTIEGFVTLPIREQLLPSVEKSLRNGNRKQLQEIVGNGLYGRPRGLLWFPVESFQCDNARMTRDMHQALKGERFPTIFFQYNRLLSVDFVENADTTPKLNVGVSGGMALAGTANGVRIETTIDPKSRDRFRLSGQFELRMTEYNIDPPTALMGLVRVRDRVTVDYKITARQIQDPEKARMFIQRKLKQYVGSSFVEENDTGLPSVQSENSIDSPDS